MKPVPLSAVTLSATQGKLLEYFIGSWQECMDVYVAVEFCNIKPCLKLGRNSSLEGSGVYCSDSISSLASC